MAFQELTDNIHNVSQKVQDFVESTAEFYKLRLFKSAMKGAISLVNLLVFGSIFLFVLLFFSIGAALWIGVELKSPYAGFLIVGGFYGIVTLFLVIFGMKMIEKSLILKFSKLLNDEDDVDPKIVAEKEVAEFSQTVITEKTA